MPERPEAVCSRCGHTSLPAILDTMEVCSGQGAFAPEVEEQSLAILALNCLVRHQQSYYTHSVVNPPVLTMKA